MSQINVNPGGPPVREDTRRPDSGGGDQLCNDADCARDRRRRALFFLFSGPIGAFFRGGSHSSVDVNVNTPGQTTQPSAPSAPQVSNPARRRPCQFR